MEQAKVKAYERLKELLAASESSDYSWVSSGKSTEWERNVQAALRRLFGEKSEHVTSFKNVSYSPMVFTDGMPDSVWAECFREGMVQAQAIMRAAIQETEDYDVEGSNSTRSHRDSTLSINSSRMKTSRRADIRKVFVVHGHDAEMREAVARFLEKLGLEPVVLSEQASSGNTVIEKFERFSDVKFAIVLLSPDDVGTTAMTPAELRSRPRQNVVLELGYFLGRLGRDRVCPLVRGKLDLPSDFHGVVYVAFEAETWKLHLMKELKAAGLDIDANLAF